MHYSQLLRATLTTLLFINLSYIFAQEEDSVKFTKYNWEENRKRFQLTKEEEKLPKIILSEKNMVDYYYENDQLVEYNTIHKIVRVNSSDAIEDYNKIAIAMNSTIEIVEIKARSFSVDGKIKELNKENIKELADDKKDNSQKVFAIEGVEKGSEIEYLVTQKMYPLHYSCEIFQYNLPVKYSYFKLTSPSNLKYKFKGYNNFPALIDTTYHSRNHYIAEMQNIPALESEGFSNYQNCRMRVEYKLAKNIFRNNKELYSWSQLGQNLHDNIYTVEKNEKKAVEKLLKTLNVASATSVEEKIKWIENYIKNNIQIEETYGDQVKDLNALVQKKYGSTFIIIKLYANLFKEAKITHQIVITSDRDKVKFDGSFETWRYARDYIFYFDDVDNYLAPQEVAYRFGMIPAGNTYNEGLFLKTVTVGDFTSAITSVKFIPALDYSKTFNDLDIEYTFNESMDGGKIKVKNIMGGYYGMYFQPYYPYMTDEKKKEMVENVMKSYVKDKDIVNISVKNGEKNLSPLDKPFEMYAEAEGPSLIENAHTKVLFKIGEIIGPQAEMYQDKKRIMPVENDFNRMYVRKIKFKIPKGYKVKNLDDLKIDKYCEKDGKKIFEFKSYYIIKNDEVTIHVNETYKEIECPMDQFEKFREVINAAADFNKIVLVLEPVK